MSSSQRDLRGFALAAAVAFGLTMVASFTSGALGAAHPTGAAASVPGQLVEARGLALLAWWPGSALTLSYLWLRGRTAAVGSLAGLLVWALVAGVRDPLPLVFLMLGAGVGPMLALRLISTFRSTTDRAERAMLHNAYSSRRLSGRRPREALAYIMGVFFVIAPIDALLLTPALGHPALKLSTQFASLWIADSAALLFILPAMRTLLGPSLRQAFAPAPDTVVIDDEESTRFGKSHSARGSVAASARGSTPDRGREAALHPRDRRPVLHFNDAVAISIASIVAITVVVITLGQSDFPVAARAALQTALLWSVFVAIRIPQRPSALISALGALLLACGYALAAQSAASLPAVNPRVIELSRVDPAIPGRLAMMDIVVTLIAMACIGLVVRAIARDQVDLQLRLSGQARLDPVTGLFNDQGLTLALAEELNADERVDSGLLALELPGHELATEQFGTAESVRIEQTIARALEQIEGLRIGARIGPGRFQALFVADAMPRVRSVARALHAQVAAMAFRAEHSTLHLQPRIGALHLDQDTLIDAEECRAVLQNAVDIAGSVRDPTLHVEPLTQMMLDNRRAEQQKIEQIREAIRDGAIELYAQPVVGAPQVISFEVLTRLRDRSGNLIQPPEFLDLATQAQLLVPLDRAVISHAFRWLGESPEARDADWYCSINLSAATINDSSIGAWIIEQCDRHDVSARRVFFEISETDAMRNPAGVSILVDLLGRRGFSIALDDFGRGLAGLEMLKRFPLTYLKIDGACVRNLLDSPTDEEIVTTSVRIARRMNLHTAAEHVNDPLLAQRLKALGVDYLQGELFGEAVPLAAIFEKPRVERPRVEKPADQASPDD